MKCKYVTMNDDTTHPMPNNNKDIMFKNFMEKLADKYETSSLTLSPEYYDEDVYVFTYKIPKKFNSKEYLEIWDNLVKEKNNYAKKINKKEFVTKYTVNLKRWNNGANPRLILWRICKQ